MKVKNNHIIAVLSSVVCLLPIILSLAIYSELPEKIAIHWDSTGNPDNYASKAFAAFGLPILFMFINIYVNFYLHNSPKRANASAAVTSITTWFVPFLSLVLMPITLFIAMGVNIPLLLIGSMFTGIVLILFGNYLPKSRQNYVIGIKLPWTLNNADNWNKTHRMAGYLWIIGGIALIVGSFLLYEKLVWGIFSLTIIALLIIIPRIYSYLLYKRHSDDEQDNG